MSEPLRFESKRQSDSVSWQRARPTQALIEQLAWDTWLVTLPGGNAHKVQLSRERGAYVGCCDCESYQYRGQACAHLCTLRKAAFGHIKDVRGQLVEIVDPDMERAQHVDRLPARADGGERR